MCDFFGGLKFEMDFEDNELLEEESYFRKTRYRRRSWHNSWRDLQKIEDKMYILYDFSLNHMFPTEHTFNYLEDCSFEHKSGSIYGNAFIVEKYARNGKKCLLIQEETKIPLPFISETNLYTLSFFVKTNVDIKFGIYNDKTLVSENVIIKSNQKYHRCVINTYLENQKEYYLFIQPIETGYIYLDDFQLEKGEVANYVNWIENSNFHYGIEKWNVSSSFQKSYITDYYNDRLLHGIKLIPNENENQIISQEVLLDCKKGETLSFSFLYLTEEHSNYLITIYLKKDNQVEKTYSYKLYSNEKEWQPFQLLMNTENKCNKISFKIESKKSKDPISLVDFSLVKEECLDDRLIILEHFFLSENIECVLKKRKRKEKISLKFNEDQDVIAAKMNQQEYKFYYDYGFLKRIEKNKEIVLKVHYTKKKDVTSIERKNNLIFCERDKRNRLEYISTNDQTYQIIYNNFNQIDKICSEKETLHFFYKKNKIIIKKDTDEKEEIFEYNNWDQFVEKVIFNLLK